MDIQKLSQSLYLMKIANQKIAQQFEEEIGFSLTRYELLLAIQAEQPCTQNQLQAALHIDQAAIARHLKILEAKGYIKRRRNPDNQREVFVEVSPKAEQEIKACASKHKDLQELFYPDFTAAELEEFLRLLKKLNQKQKED